MPIKLPRGRDSAPDPGCPCGCLTRLPWLDDPDCARNRPLQRAVDWPSYTAADLGIGCNHQDLGCPAWRLRRGAA